MYPCKWPIPTSIMDYTYYIVDVIYVRTLGNMI